MGEPWLLVEILVAGVVLKEEVFFWSLEQRKVYCKGQASSIKEEIFKDEFSDLVVEFLELAL